MGRRIPADNQNLPLIHPLLQLSFLAATLAASIAIITALCGVRSRKKSSSPSSFFDPLHTTKDSDVELPHTTEAEKSQDGEATDNMQIKDLPLPPALQQPKDSKSPTDMKKATSERRLSFSLCIKVPRSLSVAKSSDPKEDGGKKDKLKTEDSVWMKTIILGDKCVPDQEEDAVIYEGKGKKISAYHPKNNNSMSISRQTSFVDPDALPDSNLQKDNRSYQYETNYGREDDPPGGNKIRLSKMSNDTADSIDHMEHEIRTTS